MTEKTLGIIGGSGLYDLPGLTNATEHEIDTPFGRPSDVIVTGELDGVRCAFLPRHGRGHRIAPHELPFRANIHAMKQLGMGCIIGISAVGSLREEIVPGDLVLIDAGAEIHYYTADVTRTFPANGRFSRPQRRVYEHVLRAQRAAIDEARPGRPYRAMHEAALRELVVGMVDLGLLKGDVDQLLKDEAYKPYYMHGTGHWLGLDVHDVGLYHGGGASRPLQPGMVVTVEPGIYIPIDDTNAPEDLRGIGIRIEDDVLVTDGDPDVLTAAIPKDVDEVEAACQGR